MAERCDNCERMIGNLEPAHVHEGHVVCEECKAVLSSAIPATATVPSIPYASTAGEDRLKPELHAGFTCRCCGSHLKPRRRQQGSAAIAFLLVLFFLFPGLLYMMFCRKWVMVCCECGCVIGEVSSPPNEPDLGRAILAILLVVIIAALVFTIMVSLLT